MRTWLKYTLAPVVSENLWSLIAPLACSPGCLTVDGDPGSGGAEYDQYDSIFYFGES